MLARRWSSIVGGSVGGANDFLNTPPPRHVLHALTQSCRGSTKQSSRRGLLSAVGYTNLVDVSKLVKSPQVQEGIEKGKKTVSDEVKNLKISSKLPSESELGKAQTDLEKAIDILNLNALINSTNSSLLNPTSIENLIAQLTNFSNNQSLTNNFTNGISTLNEVVEQMKNLQPEMNSTRGHLQKVEEGKSEILQPVKGLIGAFNATIKTASNESKLTVEVENQYDKVIKGLLEFMENDDGVAFSKLTQELFPCEEAYRAVNVALAVSCGDEGALNRFVGVVYV
ncbi:unnamed protein product, partial [Mesocestoides corti]